MNKDMNLLYNVATRYVGGHEFFGMKCEYDQVCFDSCEELVKFIRGESAHNWLDDSCKLQENEVIEQIWTQEVEKKELDTEKLEFKPIELEDEIGDWEDDEEWYDVDDDYSQNMPCDNYGMCAGPNGCSRYFSCQCQEVEK